DGGQHVRRASAHHLVADPTAICLGVCALRSAHEGSLSQPNQTVRRTTPRTSDPTSTDLARDEPLHLLAPHNNIPKHAANNASAHTEPGFRARLRQAHSAVLGALGGAHLVRFGASVRGAVGRCGSSTSVAALWVLRPRPSEPRPVTRAISGALRR